MAQLSEMGEFIKVTFTSLLRQAPFDLQLLWPRRSSQRHT